MLANVIDGVLFKGTRTSSHYNEAILIYWRNSQYLPVRSDLSAYATVTIGKLAKFTICGRVLWKSLLLLIAIKPFK